MLKVIVTDKSQFRPASFWSTTYLPKTLLNHQRFMKNNPIILYVSREDQKYLNGMDFVEGTIWITTKDSIPPPQWKCEQDCIADLQIRYIDIY